MILMAVPETLFLTVMARGALASPDTASFGALGLSGLTAEQLWMVFPVLVPMAILPAVVGFGFLKQRSWARPMGTFLWLGFGLVVGAAQGMAGLGPAHVLRSLLWGVVFTAIAAWYFYGRESIRAYYGGLQARPA